MFLTLDFENFEQVQCLQVQSISRLSEALSAHALNVDLLDIQSLNRESEHEVRARQLALSIAYYVGNCSFTNLGRAFGRDRTTVRHACEVIYHNRVLSQQLLPLVSSTKAFFMYLKHNH